MRCLALFIRYRDNSTQQIADLLTIKELIVLGSRLFHAFLQRAAQWQKEPA